MEKQNFENQASQKNQTTKIGIIIGAVVACVALVAVVLFVILGGNGKNNNNDNNSNNNNNIIDDKNESISDTSSQNCTHIYSGWSTILTPNCKNEGRALRKCSKCNYEETKVLEKTSIHTEVIDASKAATCTTVGLTEGKHCSTCGKVIVSQTELPIVSHIFDNKYDANCNVCGFERDAECAHNYIERDGRIICSICKEVCIHNYELQGSEMYCTICLYKCKHNFKNVSGKQICEHCDIECTHNYMQENGIFTCTICKKTCEHDYKSVNEKQICSECGAEKVVLTTKNITDYLTFTTSYKYISEYKNGLNKIVSGKITVHVARKQNVEFNNLEIVCDLKITGAGWSTQTNKKMSIPFNGEGTYVFNVESDYTFPVATTDIGNITVIVTSIKGDLK